MGAARRVFFRHNISILDKRKPEEETTLGHLELQKTFLCLYSWVPSRKTLADLQGD